MANFKGFKQVSLATYNGYSDAEKKNYLWLVRDLSGETVLSAAIYFGTRKYAEVNDDSALSAKVDSIVASIGDLVDENGEWVGFLPFDEHELLGSSGITSISDALSILEAAILENSDAIAGKVSQAEYDQKVEELEDAIDSKVDTADYEAKIAEIEEQIGDMSEGTISAITQEIEAISSEMENKADKDEVAEVKEKADNLEDTVSALTEVVATKADAADVYTKDEVYTKEETDARIARLFHWAGNAEAISNDFTTITVDGEDIVAGSDNEGAVYQIGDKEYASNGEIWEELGFNIDLTNFATKEFVNSAITAEAAAREALAEEVAIAQEAIAREIEAREDLAEEVEEIKSTSTTTANTFTDAENMDLQLGQIVYVVTEETVSGITYFPGAYINTQDGLKKLDSTTPSTSVTLDQRVEALENNVGSLNTLMGSETFEGDSITAAIAELQNDSTHIIEGDDVEE